MNNHRLKSALFALAIITQPVQICAKGDSNEGLKNFITGVVVVGAAVGTVVGLHYLTRPSNETLIHRAYDTEKYYEPLAYDMVKDTYGSSEADLLRFAEKYVNAADDSVANALRSQVDTVHNLRANLLSRKDECAKDALSERDALEQRAEALCLIELGLKKAAEYAKKHRDYFELYACQKQLSEAYGTVMGYAQRPNGAVYVRNIVAANGINSYDSYPVISYVEKLNYQITKLENVLQKSSSNYVLYTQARALSARLLGVRLALAYDYNEQMKKREEARREEERNRIEQERLAVECRKVRALEDHTRALKNQTQEMRYFHGQHRHCKDDYCHCNRRAECPAVKGYAHRFCTYYNCHCNRRAECPMAH